MRFASLALTVAMGLSLAPAPALAALVPLELQKLTPDGARPSFGMHVALDGDEAIVSATGAEVDGVPNAGEAYYFRRQDGAWLAPQTLMAPTPNPGGGFGRALLGGGLAFVAEPRNSHGQVFVYDIQGGVVAATPTQILTASSPVVGAEFGEALALWGDWLAVGSPGGGAAEGVQLFHYEGGAWVAQQLLLPASDDIRFGVELAMDAGVLMVAAMGSSGDRVHVFREVAGLWQLDQTLSAVPAASDDGFGVLALDAQTALIGAPWAEAATGKVYRFQDNTSSWLFADEMAPEVAIAGDHTGISVALDGQVAVVTASLADGGAAESGVAYLYERASGAWSTPTVVVPSDVTFSQQFGIASALDGDTLMISSFGGTGSPAVYVYRLVDDKEGTPCIEDDDCATDELCLDNLCSESGMGGGAAGEGGAGGGGTGGGGTGGGGTGGGGAGGAGLGAGGAGGDWHGTWKLDENRSDGCGCRLDGRSSDPNTWSWLTSVAGILVMRRRRGKPAWRGPRSR